MLHLRVLDEIGCATVLATQQHSLGWGRAIDFLAQAPARRLAISLSGQNAALMACEQRWRVAWRLLRAGGALVACGCPPAKLSWLKRALPAEPCLRQMGPTNSCGLMEPKCCSKSRTTKALSASKRKRAVGRRLSLGTVGMSEYNPLIIQPK